MAVHTGCTKRARQTIRGVETGSQQRDHASCTPSAFLDSILDLDPRNTRESEIHERRKIGQIACAIRAALITPWRFSSSRKAIRFALLESPGPRGQRDGKHDRDDELAG